MTPVTSLVTCTLLLRDPATNKRTLFAHVTIASTEENALSIATAMANVRVRSQGSELVIEDYIITPVDRETLEHAARNILGWEPAPEELKGEH